MTMIKEYKIMSKYRPTILDVPVTGTILGCSYKNGSFKLSVLYVPSVQFVTEKRTFYGASSGVSIPHRDITLIGMCDATTAHHSYGASVYLFEIDKETEAALKKQIAYSKTTTGIVAIHKASGMITKSLPDKKLALAEMKAMLIEKDLYA